MAVYSRYSDQQLIELLRDGDKLAYTEIYNRYQPLLFLHAAGKMGDEQEAKDVIQEIFTDLWIRREELQVKSSISAYFYTAVRNKFVNLLQHQAVRNRYKDSFQQFISQASELPDGLILEKQLAESIEMEINALPEKMRKVFVLSRKEHKTYKEIALELGISEETVRKQIKNALKILKARLGPTVFFLISFLP